MSEIGRQIRMLVTHWFTSQKLAGKSMGHKHPNLLTYFTHDQRLVISSGN